MGLRAYWEVTKPRLWFLLVYTGIGGYFVASRGALDPRFPMVLAALIAGTAGANAITNYIDRDIDSVMVRTRRRPLPSGRIYPPWKALVLGLVLAAVALALTYAINIYAFAFMLLGLLDNIVVYSMLLKRRNPINIIVGSFSGGCPVVIGYSAYAGTVDVLAVLMAALIVLWTPVHIWSLALYYRDDYRRAGVPMLPVVTSTATAIRCIAATSILLAAFSYIIPLLHEPFNTVQYYAAVTVINSILLAAAFRLIARPDMRWAWRLFKITSPYLAVIFTVFIVLSAG